MSRKTLLDTDVLSAVMRRTPSALQRASAYLIDQGHLTFSLITRFEVLRGLKAKRAMAQQSAFEVFCAKSEVLPITDTIIVRAADLYAALHKQGRLIPDADLLIAATALEHDLTLATNNESHFSRVTDLRIDNWLA